MKSVMMKNTYLLLFTLFVGFTAFGQQSNPSDAELGNAHDLAQITQEWNAWFKAPTPENAFIGEFMQEYQVPQSGQNGLNRLETWYWWASHHPVQIDEYVERRNNFLSQEE